MSSRIYTDEEFSAGSPPESWSNCVFERCSFHFVPMQGVDLRRASFEDCRFEGCDWTGLNLTEVGLKSVTFDTCKLMGLHFEQCDSFLLEMRFQSCRLDFSSFHGMKLAKTPFRHCQITGVDFTYADLSHAIFLECDLHDSRFEHTNMRKADFSASWGMIFDPSTNDLRGARFDLSALPGLVAHTGIEVND